MKDPFNNPAISIETMIPNQTTLALVPFKGSANAPSPKNEISNNGEEKRKELAVSKAKLKLCLMAKLRRESFK